MNPSILIYRDALLAYSETFIRAQAESMKCHTAHYLGSRLNSGIQLPEDRTIIINTGAILGRARELAFKVRGPMFGLLDELKAISPQLVHAHFGPDGMRAIPIAKRLRVPLIITFHGFDATTSDEEFKASPYYSTRHFVRRRNHLIEQTHLFIAVSSFIKRKLLCKGFPEDKVVVHYIGVDTEFFSPNPELPRSRTVLFVGRLAQKKGCEYLLRAMSKVQIADPQAKLVLIGEGPLRSDLDKLARGMSLNALFLGAQTPEIVREWMNRSSVFCVPSVTAENGDAEGFGMVFAEAQAMALPVVSFNSGGIPEAVEHGVTGLLSAEKDWEGIAESIEFLLSNSDLWRRMSLAGFHRVRDHFDLRRQTPKLEELYRKVLQSVPSHCEVPIPD
jgi:colanic acid/amylovoran biosynthesis glycosyltransferase